MTNKNATAKRNTDITKRHKQGELLQSIADTYGLTRERVRQIAGKAGATPRRVLVTKRIEARENAKGKQKAARQAAKAKWMKPYMARIKAGDSFNAVSGGDRNLAAQIRAYAAQQGIKSLARSKWDDYRDRLKIVKAMRAKGAIWAEVAVAVSKAEAPRRPVAEQTVYAWARKRGLV